MIVLKPLTLWITTNCGKLLKRWEHQTTLPASREICMQIKKQQLQLDMEQWVGSKSGKEYVKAVYYHLAYLTYMQRRKWQPTPVFLPGESHGRRSLVGTESDTTEATQQQSITCEMLGWMKHKLESSLSREILITSDMTPPLQ